eukprot:scaffold286421_cov73-Attheya_sp.AAC.1
MWGDQGNFISIADEFGRIWVSVRPVPNDTTKADARRWVRVLVPVGPRSGGAIRQVVIVRVAHEEVHGIHACSGEIRKARSSVLSRFTWTRYQRGFKVPMRVYWMKHKQSTEARRRSR